MSPEQAETVALQALGWLAAQEDLFGVFLGSSGSSLSDVKVRASEPEFLGSVLDFLLMDDTWVVAFSDAHGLKYDVAMRARVALPGGAEVSWT